MSGIAAAWAAAMPAFGQGGASPNADQVFQAASRSVVSVHVFDPQASSARKRVSVGSGVVIGRGRVVTNCHVLAAGIAGEGRSNEIVAEAKEAGQRTGRPVRVTGADPARDLCILDVPGLDAPVAALGSTRGLRVGQAVFAVGSPHGLELTLSGGLISALRKTGEEPIIQTDAAMSPGSSGGGLFDAEARLIGITSFGIRGGQNLNFALPVEWVRDAAVRSVSGNDFSAIVANARKLVQGGAGATASGGRWAHAARSPQGYEVYIDLGRIVRSGAQAQAWVLHNYDAPSGGGEGARFRSRVLLTDIDCAGGRWSVRHASTYTEPFATGRRISANDFTPADADYLATTPGGVMDRVRLVACR